MPFVNDQSFLCARCGDYSFFFFHSSYLKYIFDWMVNGLKKKDSKYKASIKKKWTNTQTKKHQIKKCREIDEGKWDRNSIIIQKFKKLIFLSGQVKGWESSLFFSSLFFFSFQHIFFFYSSRVYFSKGIDIALQIHSFVVVVVVLCLSLLFLNYRTLCLIIIS